MRLAFRADASEAIGSGHVMRCLSLAAELRDRDADCLFLCADLPGHLAEEVRQRGFTCVLLSGDVTKVGPDADSAECLAALGSGINWLVVDHYGIDQRWETAMRLATRRLMVIDDLADRPHDADLLLDQTSYQNAAERYAGLISAHTELCLGLHYVMLRKEFEGVRARLCRTFEAVTRILVTFGANDPINMTTRVTEILRQPKYANISVDVLGGTANPKARRVERLARGVAHMRYAVQTDQMAGMMARADLSIGAGGTTSWERCALGLPSIVVALAENQRGIGPFLEEIGVARYLGFGEDIGDDVLEGAIHAAVRDHNWRASASAKGMAMVDVGGVRRVADRLIAISAAST